MAATRVFGSMEQVEQALGIGGERREVAVDKEFEGFGEMSEKALKREEEALERMREQMLRGEPERPRERPQAPPRGHTVRSAVDELFGDL